MEKRLLIVMGKKNMAKQIQQGLGKDYEITCASDVEHARTLIATGSFPVVILDMARSSCPDILKRDLDLLGNITTLSPHTKVIVVTDNTDKEIAIKAIDLGAVDLCEKPLSLDNLRSSLSRTFKIYELEEINRRDKKESNGRAFLCGMLGKSPAMKKVFEIIRKVSNTDYPVLVTGRSGTGKEMVARAIHQLSKRSKAPMIVVNCGAIPENLWKYIPGVFRWALQP